MLFGRNSVSVHFSSFFIGIVTFVDIEEYYSAVYTSVSCDNIIYEVFCCSQTFGFFVFGKRGSEYV